MAELDGLVDLAALDQIRVRFEDRVKFFRCRNLFSIENAAAGLINDTAKLSGRGHFHVEPQSFSAIFAIAVTICFWRKNVIGMHESSQKALRIMQITTVMVVMLIGCPPRRRWCRGQPTRRCLG